MKKECEPSGEKTVTCLYCNQVIRPENGVWVDPTGGDVCGYDGGNEPHLPVATQYIQLSIKVENYFATPQEAIDYLRSRIEDDQIKVLSAKWDACACADDIREKVHVEPFRPNTVVEALREFNITLPKSQKVSEWRSLDPQPYGEVNGLNTLRGRLVATNGILAILIRGDKSWAYVHLQHFIPDILDEESEIRKMVSSAKAKAPKRPSQLEQALAMYE